VFVFRGRRGDLIKVLWYDGDGLCLFAKRLERGRFVWPQATNGTVSLTRAQLSMLLEGIDWRWPERTFDPNTSSVNSSIYPTLQQTQQFSFPLRVSETNECHISSDSLAVKRRERQRL